MLRMTKIRETIDCLAHCITLRANKRSVMFTLARIYICEIRITLKLPARKKSFSPLWAILAPHMRRLEKLDF